MKRICSILASLSMFASLSVYAVNSTDTTLQLNVQPGAVITMDQGYINWPSGGGVGKTFNTNKICPFQYNAYIEMTPSKMYTNNQVASGSQQVLTGFGICVSAIVPAGNNYLVTYFGVRRYAPVYSRAYSGLIYVSDTYGYFGSGSMQTLPLDSTTTRVSGVAYDYTPDYVNAPGGISWTLYCYPPGLTYPSAATGCAAGTNPF